MDSPESADLRRAGIVFALRLLSPKLRNDVLADGHIAAIAELEVTHPISLPGGLVLERDVLFSVLRDVANEGAWSGVVADVAGVATTIEGSLDQDAVVLTYCTNRTHFPYSGLFATRTQRRKEIGTTCLFRNTISTDKRRAFEELLTREPFTHYEFLEASKLLETSLESFSKSLLDQAGTGLPPTGFLPEHLGYWDNLCARRDQSTTLHDFVGRELLSARRAVMERDLSKGIEIASLSFSAPELVQLEIPVSAEGDAVLLVLQKLTESCDPFALAGLFDACVSRVTTDRRFVELGDALLLALFSNPAQLLRRLVTYGTAFILATAHFAEHQVLRRQPVFWRRVTAAAHAALVARTLGAAPGDEDLTLGWAMQARGRQYFLSVLIDSFVEYRWRPEWIRPHVLLADIYGRVSGSLARLPADTVPPSWTTHLAEAAEWITSQGIMPAAGFPSIAQGGLPLSNVVPEPGSPVSELNSRLIKNPSTETLMSVAPVVYGLGFYAETREAVLSVLDSLRSGAPSATNETTSIVLALAACIAVQRHDDELGSLVAEICIERATVSSEFLQPAVFIMTECAASTLELKSALATLAQRLEKLALVSAPSAMVELIELLGALRSINEDIGPLLGRAFSIARLGRSFVPAP